MAKALETFPNSKSPEDRSIEEQFAREDRESYAAACARAKNMTTRQLVAILKRSGIDVNIPPGLLGADIN